MNELHYFRLLDRTEQQKTVQRLLASGMTEVAIASITSLSIEQIRRMAAKSSEVSA